MLTKHLLLIYYSRPGVRAGHIGCLTFLLFPLMPGTQATLGAVAKISLVKTQIRVFPFHFSPVVQKQPWIFLTMLFHHSCPVRSPTPFVWNITCLHLLDRPSKLPAEDMCYSLLFCQKGSSSDVHMPPQNLRFECQVPSMRPSTAVFM